MTITLEEAVYDVLYRVVGSEKIDRFIEDFVRPHVLKEDLASAYRSMAADTEREGEALEWIEGIIGDVSEGKV